MRLPLELYALQPTTQNDGLDASYRLYFGELTNTVRAQAGKNDVKLPHNAGTAKVRESRAISNTIEYGPLTARISYHTGRLVAGPVAPLFDAFRQFGPQGVAIADKYDSNNKATFTAVGASYDPGDWFVMGEWGRVRSRLFIGNKTSWYASGGYRFGKFTPYVMYARARADNLSDPGLTVSALPPFLAGPATGLNGALNSILRANAVQNTLSVGGRWDATKNTALKLQFDHTRIGAGSNGVLINIQPGFQTGGKVNVFSATLDFVF